MAKVTKDQRTESIERLISEDGYNLKPGDTVYTSHHGSNGTMLKVYVVNETRHNGPQIFNITWHVARALGMNPRDKNGEWFLHNPVYGMDRGFDVVYRLGRVLFSGQTDRDAGYALHHRWL